MNSSIALRTVTVAAAALLTIPGAALAQTPPTTPPATAQPTPAPQDPAQSAATPSAAQEHLRQAKAALNDVATANLNAKAKAQVAELKKRVSTLERAIPANDSVSAPKAASAR